MSRNNINSKKNFLAVSPLSIAKGPYMLVVKKNNLLEKIKVSFLIRNTINSI